MWDPRAYSFAMDGIPEHLDGGNGENAGKDLSISVLVSLGGIMSDAVLVNPREYDADLHDVYAAFMGYFERKGFQWWNHSFASYFTTFNDFLAFGWGAIVVTDRRTGKGHVAVRSANPEHHGGSVGQGGTVQQFARMIKVRFGESLPKLPNQLPIDPFESKPRLIRIINDQTTYKRLHATIPSAELNARRKKLRAGDPGEVHALWTSRNHTFLALEAVWWEKGNGVVLEAGVAAMRCRNIDAMDSWPPLPDENYRRSHYVVSEWLDKRTNTNHHMPSMPRSYAHGESQPVSMAALEKIINATISTLSSPESESQANTLVIVSVNNSSRLQDLRNVHIPANVLIIDLPHFERALFRSPHSHPASGSNSPNSPSVSLLGTTGESGHPPRHLRSKSLTQVPSMTTRDPSHLLSLRGMLAQCSIPVPPHIPLSNAGNAAFYVLLLFHILVDRDCVPPAVLSPTPPQQQQQQHRSLPVTPYGIFPMTHMPYPHLQIYPPAGSSPLALPKRTGSPSRARVPGRPQQSQPQQQPPQQQPQQGTFKRSTTMYWDDPPSAGPPNHQNQPPIERRRSGDLPGAMGRMTIGGAGTSGQRERERGERTHASASRPVEHARRYANGDR